MKKLAIIGASGFLGRRLKTMLCDTYDIIGTCQSGSGDGLVGLDITKRDDVDRFFDVHRPEITIHVAAMSSPDGCELHKEQAEAINHHGTANIAKACARSGSLLVYASTSYVFDGTEERYRETDACRPVNFYGETKLRGEAEALNVAGSIVLRFDLLYGYNEPDDRKGFFAWLLRGEGTGLDDVQKRHPLFVDDVADAIKILLRKKKGGIYHLGGPKLVTSYALGTAIEAAVCDRPKITPAKDKKYTAARPMNISLDTAKAQEIGIHFSTLAEAIQSVKKRIGR